MFLVTSVTGTGSRWPATRFRRRGKRSAARGYNRRSCTTPTTCVGTRGNPRGFSRVILPLDSSQALGDWAGASRKTSALVSWGSTALICFGSRAARMAILSFQTLLALLRPHYPLRCEARQFKESATCPNGYSGLAGRKFRLIREAWDRRYHGPTPWALWRDTIGALYT